jgi:glutamate dehydrogenase/leucine dehydrogenase
LRGIQAAVKYVFNSDLQGKPFAIQGVENVGLRLARDIYKAGAKTFDFQIFMKKIY